MDYDLILEILFKGIIVPIIPLASIYLQKLITVKINEINSRVENEHISKYLNIAKETLQSCVAETTQTYVESLKLQGKFDKQAQENAMILTKQTFLTIISKDTKNVLEEMFDDYDSWITTTIEEIINSNKW